MTAPVKSLIPLKDGTREDPISYSGKYTGILDQEEQVSTIQIASHLKAGRPSDQYQ